ncbi:hypothetical protein FRB96_005664 [Tulasnella sp. 330]|nr:hypothetical protein FRB96_005664 [Tulasnella sp. 330]KAG8882664.1 hypothetical protein FRB98_003555 [Tulasnella sp. 332]
MADAHTTSIPVRVDSVIEADPSVPFPQTLGSVPENATVTVEKDGEVIPEVETVSAAPKHSPFGALLSRALPRYTGAYKVGVTDIELPVPRRTFGNFKHKKLSNAEAGLSMETVFFTLFYPSDPNANASGKVVWFPKLGQTVDGFLKMAKRTPNLLYRSVAYPIAAATITGTTFPAYESAHMKSPPTGERWPLMLFSHGVGCSRLMYSSFCGEMASRGYVVAAIEHRDGTGPSSTIRTANGKIEKLDWLQWSDLIWPDLPEQPKDDTTLRHEQIALRLAECEEVITALRQVSRGEHIVQTALTPVNTDFGKWIDASRPIMAGHSLGGSLALAAAADSRFDFSHVIATDPAVQRLEPWTGKVPCPLLVITSEEFVTQEDFARTIRVCKTAKSANVFTIAGSTHPSFSDIHLILPNVINRLMGLGCSPELVVDKTIQTTTAFLTGNIQSSQKAAMLFKGKTKPNRPIGPPGTFYWHRDAEFDSA